MKNLNVVSAAENRIMRYSAEMMEPLGGLQRSKESTFEAIGNIGEGVKQIITGTNGRLRGLARVGQGILDVADTGVSAIADGVRSLSGMPSNGASGRYSITRAFRDYQNIRTNDAMNTIKDTTAYVAGLVHAVVFKPVSDLLRAVSKP